MTLNTEVFAAVAALAMLPALLPSHAKTQIEPGRIYSGGDDEWEPFLRGLCMARYYTRTDGRWSATGAGKTGTLILGDNERCEQWSE